MTLRHKNVYCKTGEPIDIKYSNEATYGLTSSNVKLYWNESRLNRILELYLHCDDIMIVKNMI